MRAGDRADDVEGALDVGDPVAHRLVQRVLQRARSRFDRHYRRAKQLHAIDVLHLALDVLRAHVHHAFHAVARRDGRRGDAVHAGARLGNHARLAHAARKQCLADGVVDLVRAGVVQVFALDVDLRAAAALRQPPSVVDRARPPHIVLELVVKLGLERGIGARALIGIAQLVERVRQRFGDEHAAVGAEMPARVGQVIHPHS